MNNRLGARNFCRVTRPYSLTDHAKKWDTITDAFLNTREGESEIMQTCAYCGSGVEPVGNGLYCSFCDMEVYQDDVQTNGRRRPVQAEETVLLSFAERSTQEIMEKDSYYLILLLRLVRDERKRAYNLLRIVNKGAAVQPDTAALQAGQDEGAKNYKYWTRKAWIIENILRDRAGYYPAKITDGLLSGILEQVQESNEKPMTFSPK